MTRALAVAMLGAAALCAPACRQAAPAGPPELRLGVDACDGCGMAISDPRYAAAVLEDQGAEPRVLKFDDIGCLARWEAHAQGARIRARWVHDGRTGAWIDAAAASYVKPRDLATPMGSGLVARASRAEAEALAAAEGAGTLSWDAVLASAKEEHR